MSSYTIPDNAVLEKVGNEAVMLNMDDGQYFGLDEIGSQMLDLLQQTDDIDSVIGTLQQEYDASPEQIRNDLLALLEQLQQHGLVQKHP